MKVFDNFDLQNLLEKTQKSANYGVACENADLRFCKAHMRAGYRKDARNFYVILQSYSHDTIALVCDDRGRVSWAAFYPYRSTTTWHHVRKFCALFRNGRELYCAYRDAAHGGRQNRDFY